MKPPSNSRDVLTRQQDMNGNESWAIDYYMNDIWGFAEAWESKVVSWQELPQPPNLLCDKDCELCSAYQDKKDCYDATLRKEK